MADTEIVEGYTPNFEAWIKDFSEWQTRIGFDPSWLGDYRFDIKLIGIQQEVKLNLEISKVCLNGKEECKFLNKISEMLSSVWSVYKEIQNLQV
jgi:hypothetical protein